ncbi:MAG: transcriptional repressor [Patescibacteria group bacterium]|nr:transcriptional repressor [Patescibacteria group bacterium]
MPGIPDPKDELRHTLKAHSFSMTTARSTVFDALLDKEPQTMREVVDACQKLVDRASVYRVVSLYERLGIVQRLQMGWKYKLELSDDFHRHHHHLTCTKCHVVIPISENDELEDHLYEAAQKHGFKMEGHQLEIQGVCAICQHK